MVKRFKIVDKEYIKELKDKSENKKNIKKSMEYWKNVFQKWANERNILQVIHLTQMTELLQMMKFKEINIKKTIMLKIYLIHQVIRQIFKFPLLLAGMHTLLFLQLGWPAWYLT